MSSYNSDELEAPAWINQEFLQEVLTKYENKGKVEIINHDLKPASMKGDHYASVMFRCKVEYRFVENASFKSMSFIIKTLPMQEGMKREMLMETTFFENEIAMISDMLPKIEEILKDCGEATKMAAGIIYHSLQPHKVIILEDLCESGYDTIRGRHLTEFEIKAVYRKLAKLHAVSYMLGQSDSAELVTKFQDGFLSSSVPSLKDIFPNGMKNFLNVLSSNDEFAIYYERVKEMQGDIEQASKNLFNAYTLNRGQGDIFVLNHGDFHMKNLMFKFNADNVMEDMVMVDYQLSCFAPSTIDLVYSQYMLLSPEFRRRRHEFMLYYFTEFLKILKKLQFLGEMPKYSQFQIANLKYRHFTLYVLAIIFPLVLDNFTKTAEELKDEDFNEMIENPDVNASNYMRPVFIEEMREMMPILLREGYLD
uniref:CHK kinase-like domain-containing protein n=1 Tax=Stomoxys calcitrans TaxID=35570 RepID=A0A1I8Q0I0_STOCA